MATDLMLTVAGCLTPPEAELVLAILQAGEERDLDGATFSGLARFAEGPCPLLALPTQEEFRKLINALAGTLKAPRTTDEQGHLQLAMYWAALKDVELFRLQGAAAHFINTAEWMPTPGQIRTKALTFGHPVYQAHARAQRFMRDRVQRLHDALMRRIADRMLTQAELDALPAEHQEAAVRRHLAVPRPEGGIVYRSADALARWEAHNRQQLLEHRKDQ